MSNERTTKPLLGERFDCVVIGAGHGGCEAALAAARMGLTTALLTLNLDSIALINAHDRKKKSVLARANLETKNQLMEFSSDYLIKALCSIDDDAVRQLACELATDSLPQLSKIHTQYAVILEERDKLLSLVPDRLYNWKNALLVQKINETKARIANAKPEELPELIEHLQDLYNVRHKLAAIIGDRVVNPK